jgi:hypothetical protein
MTTGQKNSPAEYKRKKQCLNVVSIAAGEGVLI